METWPDSDCWQPLCLHVTHEVCKEARREVSWVVSGPRVINRPPNSNSFRKARRKWPLNSFKLVNFYYPANELDLLFIHKKITLHIQKNQNTPTCCKYAGHTWVGSLIHSLHVLQSLKLSIIRHSNPLSSFISEYIHSTIRSNSSGGQNGCKDKHEHFSVLFGTTCVWYLRLHWILFFTLAYYRWSLFSFSSFLFSEFYNLILKVFLSFFIFHYYRSIFLLIFKYFPYSYHYKHLNQFLC